MTVGLAHLLHSTERISAILNDRWLARMHCKKTTKLTKLTSVLLEALNATNVVRRCTFPDLRPFTCRPEPYLPISSVVSFLSRHRSLEELHLSVEKRTASQIPAVLLDPRPFS
ncbi:hypothetical protein PAXRUDRAFT_791428 [Paxillus rubicundulus Ve08.2h10]|uniref:Uncharacterized protein n=1 Tax=Paxillus rubicundulus Ve08.2h10 TaxID=930991 RepID=A0A0D0E5J6_9AGAM|nr:hypothetical protein PAXRUDRAFT_791428 [Paxillus rubicundulus Ve08.2h10]